MSFLLNIDTSTGTAHVSISKDAVSIGQLSNPNQKEHASFLQPAIQQLLQSCGLQMRDLDAVAVVNGPGSYTGLRVGLASAKGICYALSLPLININSLTLMAHAASGHYDQFTVGEKPFLCPMIDARRMEVYTALFDEHLNEVIFPQAMILDNESFVDILLQHKILFFGNGAFKMRELTNSASALFAGDYETTRSLCAMSFAKFSVQDFADLAYSEPFYLKEFFDK
jgi:tRNA threonylcarbamoyladenosine biosynthesis protein TsaB